jgi:hypothetical protein
MTRVYGERHEQHDGVPLPVELEAPRGSKGCVVCVGAACSTALPALSERIQIGLAVHDRDSLFIAETRSCLRASTLTGTKPS